MVDAVLPGKGSGGPAPATITSDQQGSASDRFATLLDGKVDEKGAATSTPAAPAETPVTSTSEPAARPAASAGLQAAGQLPRPAPETTRPASGPLARAALLAALASKNGDQVPSDPSVSANTTRPQDSGTDRNPAEKDGKVKKDDVAPVGSSMLPASAASIILNTVMPAGPHSEARADAQASSTALHARWPAAASLGPAAPLPPSPTSDGAPLPASLDRGLASGSPAGSGVLPEANLTAQQQGASGASSLGAALRSGDAAAVNREVRIPEREAAAPARPVLAPDAAGDPANRASTVPVGPSIANGRASAGGSTNQSDGAVPPLAPRGVVSGTPALALPVAAPLGSDEGVTTGTSDAPRAAVPLPVARGIVNGTPAPPPPVAAPLGSDEGATTGTSDAPGAAVSLAVERGIVNGLPALPGPVASQVDVASPTMLAAFTRALALASGSESSQMPLGVPRNERGPLRPVASVVPIPLNAPPSDSLGADRLTPAAPIFAAARIDDGGLERQIVQAIRMQWRGGLGEATIKLQPAHLGSLIVSLKVGSGAVSATVQAETPMAQQWIAAHESDLRSALERHGLTLERLVVSQDSERQRRFARPQRPPTPPSRSRRRTETAAFHLVA